MRWSPTVKLMLVATLLWEATSCLTCQAKPPVQESEAIETLKTARTTLHWDEPAEPFHLVGPISFVGTKGLGAFLLHGSEGDILINTAMPGSGPMIEASIRNLGFDPSNLKLILAGHAHSSHVGGHAYLKKLTGAKIAFLKEEKELFESGGRTDFLYGNIKEFEFEGTEVDRVLEDKEEIILGDLSVTVLKTAGHSKGATTFVTKVDESGRSWTVLFPNGTGVNSGCPLIGEPAYEGILEDYLQTFDTLEHQKPEIWFHYHTEVTGLHEKQQRSTRLGPKAWLDAEGYRKWIAHEKRQFQAELEKQKKEQLVR